MGVPTEIWRARIGGYFPGISRTRPDMAAINLHGRRLGVHILLAFVLVFIVLPYAGQTENMCTSEWPGLFSLWDTYRDMCHAQSTSNDMVVGYRMGTALLEQEGYCLFATYSYMSLLLAGDVELNPGPTMCTPDCKHNRQSKGEMIRCCACACWFHEDCMGITSDEETGVWPCPECRLTGVRLKSLMGTVEDLSNLVGKLSSSIEKLDRERKDDVAKLYKQIETLTKENAELSNKIANSTPTLPDERSRPKSIVVGDSLVKDLDEKKLVDTDVDYQRDARVLDVIGKIKNLPTGYSHIALVVGGNDCDGEARPSGTDIVSSYGRLVDVAKQKARDVTVSSILPRIRSEDTRERIQAVNAGLVVLCREKGVTFANNDPYFVFADGSVNEGYIEEDGVHLTRSGLNKLAMTMNLKPKNLAKGVYGKSTVGTCDGGQWETPRQDRGHGDLHRQGQTRHQQTSSHLRRNDDIRCYYCYERGHVKGNCRHGREVRCNSCGRLGHKMKFCSQV